MWLQRGSLFLSDVFSMKYYQGFFLQVGEVALAFLEGKKLRDIFILGEVF